MTKENITLLFFVNIPCICFCLLTAFFIYMDNGYWGWPFAIAIITAHGLKSRKDLIEERKEEEFQRQKDRKAFGEEFMNKVYKN